MSESNDLHIENEEVQNEILLFEDILDMIFAKMSLKDLHRAAGVCRVWNCVAKKELTKRNHIKCLLLKMDDRSDSEDEYDDVEWENGKTRYLNRWHISDSLASIPQLLLLFNDGTNERTSEASENFYLNYWRQLYPVSTKVIVVDALGITTDSTEIIGATNLGLGIAFPSTSKLNISYFCPSMHDLHPERMNKTTLTHLLKKAEDTLAIVKDEQNCFIYFESPDSEPTDNYYGRNKTFTNEFFEFLKKSCKPGTYSLFGGSVSCITLGRNDWADWFALKISGPTMQSWSIIIQENYSRNEIEEKLFKFKEIVKLNSDSIALAMVPTDENESYQERLEKTKIFRHIFPSIHLYGIYHGNCNFGVNSTEFDPDPKLEHRNATIYLIITID